MRLTNHAILELAAALRSLDGKPDAPAPKLPGRALYAFARTLIAIRPTVEAIEKARGAIIAKHADGKDSIRSSDPGWTDCARELSELLAEESDVAIHKAKPADLEAATDVSLATLVGLDPALDHE